MIKSDDASSDPEWLASIRAAVQGYEFVYGQDSDCRALAFWTVETAKQMGFAAVVKNESTRLLMASGSIKGSDRTANTEGDVCWFFREHFWTEIEGQEYDPLFDRMGTPQFDRESGSSTYRGCQMFRFESGRWLVAKDNAAIGANAVFADGQAARQFIESKTPNYNDDDDWDA